MGLPRETQTAQRLEKCSFLFAHQEAAKAYYLSTPVQVGVAILICINFLSNIIEKEIDPDGTEYKEVFGVLEYIFNFLFLIELILNMYGHWFFKFWRDSWNWFDFVVVSIGVIMMLPLDLPKSLNLLRTMRAFRIFRLFRRVKSLKKIIVAIMLSVPGVCNAFLILTIVICIYAILGVEFFKDVGEGCNSVGSTLTVDLGTRRNRCLGEEYFGTFSRSLYSFFQVMSGDSWAEIIARPVIWSASGTVKQVGSAFYFVSFVLVTVMVLVNVVVAVLLDKMVDPEVDVEGLDDTEEVNQSEHAEVDEALDGQDPCDAGLAPSNANGVGGSGSPSASGSRASLQSADWNYKSSVATTATAASHGGRKSAREHATTTHGNTLHSRMSDIERQIRDLRRAGDDMHGKMECVQDALVEILSTVQAKQERARKKADSDTRSNRSSPDKVMIQL